MRPLWTGAISFGLIYIPVKLYSATQEIQLDLDLLSKKDHAPIRYVRINKDTGAEVPWKEIVKGYEYKKGDYVVLEEEDFLKADLEKTTVIDIECFVEAKQIDDIYFDKPYYLVPEKGAEKIYALLREALKKSNKVGVAEFVLRNREHLCAIQSVGHKLILNQMRYANEIRPTEDLEIPTKVQFREKELETAVDLIDKMTEKFEITDFKDDYIAKLKKIIEQKAKNKPVKAQGKAPDIKATIDLMDQLKASLEKMNFETSKKK